MIYFRRYFLIASKTSFKADVLEPRVSLSPAVLEEQEYFRVMFFGGGGIFPTVHCHDT